MGSKLHEAKQAEQASTGPAPSDGCSSERGEFVTPQEIASQLRVETRLVVEWCYRGILGAWKLPVNGKAARRMIRIPRVEYEAFLAEGYKPSPRAVLAHPDARQRLAKRLALAAAVASADKDDDAEDEAA